MSGDLTEEMVKKEIRSLLNSSSCISTLRSVEADYESFIGSAMPSKRLGYNSTEHFLKSIPDVCTVKGSGPYAQVFLVVNEKIAYNTKMVLEQRLSLPKSAAKRRTPNRRRWDELRSVIPSQSNYCNTNRMNYPPRAPPNFHSVPTTSFNNNRLTHPVSSQLQPTHSHVNTSQVQPLEPTQPTQPNLDRLKLFHPVQPLRLQENQPVVTPIRSDFSSVTVGTKKPLTVDHIKLNTFKELVKEEAEVEKDDSNVPKKVQENLRKLIDKFEDGLWCADLRTQYLKMFKRELLFTEYGYGSLIDMCIVLKHIFHYVRPGNDDFMLYDRSKPLPVTATKSYTISSYDPGLNRTVASIDQALPQLDWSDFRGRIPHDVFSFGENIPRQFLPKTTKPEDSFGLVVMEIYDISKFWFYLRDEEDKLNTLMDDLGAFYMNSDNAREYAIIPAAVQVGLYCVQVIFGEYHRAKVLNVLPNDKVRLLYIDFGTVDTASIKGICFLRQEFSKLPAQALRGRLANINPVEKGHPWPMTAILRFKELVNNNRATQMKVSYVDWAEQYVCGFIADVSVPDNIRYVNEILVKEGHALWDNQTQKPSLVMSKSTCIVRNLHLFPTFQELELGMALNFGETYFYSKSLVPVQYCLPNYFKVDDEGDDSYSEMYDGLMEAAKHHRKFSLLSARQDNVSPLDLNLFGAFKQELTDYLVAIGEEIPEEYEPEATSDQENLSFYSSAREKCENLIRQMNLSPGETITNLNYENLSEDDDELIEWSTNISHSESSRSEARSPPFCPWVINKTRPSDLNIFDNPEAFESLSGTPSPKTPTGEEFFKNLAIKINQNSSFLSENVNESQLQNSSNLDTSGTDLQPNIAGKIVTSNLDPTSKEFVSTLHLNNPFRQFMNLNEGDSNKTVESGIVDNETVSDSNSSEYYETISPSHVETLSDNTLRTREFVENLPDNASTTSFQTENSQSPQNPESYFGSTPSNEIPLPVQFSTPYENTPRLNWPGYSHWNGAPLSYRTPHNPPMVRPPPGFHSHHYQTQFGPFGNQVVVPQFGVQNPHAYPQYGFFPPRVPLVNLQRPDFYDRYNEQLLRQQPRNN